MKKLKYVIGAILIGIPLWLLLTIGNTLMVIGKYLTSIAYYLDNKISKYFIKQG